MSAFFHNFAAADFKSLGTNYKVKCQASDVRLSLGVNDDDYMIMMMIMIIMLVLMKMRWKWDGNNGG